MKYANVLVMPVIQVKIHANVNATLGVNSNRIHIQMVKKDRAVDNS
jgi:hypothetical protein